MGGSKVKKSIIFISVALIAVGCSSTPPTTRQQVAEVEPEYIVRERRPSQVPSWVDNFTAWKRQEEPKAGMVFFFGESGTVEDRLAGLEVARLNAKKQISEYIAHLISNKVATSTSGQLFRNPNSAEENGLRQGFEQDLAGMSMAFLSGVKDYEDYYEQRDYTKSGGARRVFECSVVVGITEKDLKEAIKKSARKAPDVVEDKEAKVKVEESLKNIDSQYRSYASSTGGN